MCFTPFKTDLQIEHCLYITNLHCCFPCDLLTWRWSEKRKKVNSQLEVVSRASFRVTSYDRRMRNCNGKRNVTRKVEFIKNWQFVNKYFSVVTRDRRKYIIPISRQKCKFCMIFSGLWWVSGCVKHCSNLNFDSRSKEKLWNLCRIFWHCWYSRHDLEIFFFRNLNVIYN